jgi:hypothetical protein
MVEVDVPKRVVIVLLVLTILVSFMGTLIFLQYYVSPPSAAPVSGDQATIGMKLLAPVKAEQHSALPSSADDSSVSVTINEYLG